MYLQEWSFCNKPHYSAGEEWGIGLVTLLQAQVDSLETQGEGGQYLKLFANHGKTTKNFGDLYCTESCHIGNVCRVVMCQVIARLLQKKIFWEPFGLLK